ncbi:hypothetical protein IQ254_06100 [Nodosilinea sp. LEGE 07088]|uniref:hypothetical protein n=1 Tax=Nodosilinea sp. LEGE 07088 TaxID=2777968 RepID=UPI0018803876|nr:hypothetical protein [Nodosilinea sp. LEGE 07088]MBE9136779.1 hypothetical protein [Nodosilinea sp. LEGE 07088]
MVSSPLAPSAQRRRAHSPIAHSPIVADPQLALAVADEPFLRSLLTESLPAIAHPHEIGTVAVQVAVPLPYPAQGRMDAVLTFEHINCVLAGSYPEAPPTPDLSNHRQYEAITPCHSDLATLAHNVPITEAEALLARSGFTLEEVQYILNLPNQGWHKSWWYSLTPEGFLTVPFQRHIRSRCYTDGTVTLQFKDHYAQQRPEAFRSQPQKLPVVVHSPQVSFCDNLAHINLSRQTVGSPQAILIADDLSELEIEGYIRQNVSLYRQRSLELVTSASCPTCAQAKCPLQGVDSSPVLACRSFRPADGPVDGEM